MARTVLNSAAIFPAAGLAGAAAVSLIGGTGFGRALAAWLVVYAFGYVTGALLVEPEDDDQTLSLAVIRLLSGLLLSTIGFLLSLVLSLPWFVGPVGLLVLAVIRSGPIALAPPRPSIALDREGAAAGLIAVVVLAPTLISSIRMAPGEFPPVFYNVDTPYFLEKVHALLKTDTYPPESLSFVDGRRLYHFGTHGLAALISRFSSIAPHHSLFLIVVPLLAAGMVAAAVILARALGPAVPSPVAVPLLLISVPTLWYPFWGAVGPRLGEAAGSLTLDPLKALAKNFELWGVASNNGQNLVAHFLALASLAALAAAPARGFKLAVFLIGGAVIFKAPTGVALAAGFALAQAFRAAATRSLRPLVPAAAAAAVFAVVYGAFWVLPRAPVQLKMELFPLFHLKHMAENGGLRGFVLDIAWLLLPALIVLLARAQDREWRSLPFLFFAVAPLVIVNSTRSIKLLPEPGVNEDWLQVMLPAPLLLRAFALSVVGRRWAGLGAGWRAAVWLVVALGVLPPVLVAARYSYVLIVHPERGHEFADNRSIAPALAVIPTSGTIIVTNDLRYPADGFCRNNRQMQIPALFGHQAFAINYAYEVYSFSAERMKLQKLLRGRQWTEAIDQAAQAHNWTHLIIRKDYAHPDPIPLERIFENGDYSVYRFGPP
jgi:hypothetical protein